MIEILLLLSAALLGWFFARRQKPTEPHVIPPKQHTEPPKYEDKIDEITKVDSYPESDRDLGAWLDDHYQGKRK